VYDVHMMYTYIYVHVCMYDVFIEVYMFD